MSSVSRWIGRGGSRYCLALKRGEELMMLPEDDTQLHRGDEILYSAEPLPITAC